MRALSILGSTGSIGRNCLNVVEDFPGDLRVVSLAAGSNGSLLAEQVERFRPQLVSVANPLAADELGWRLKKLPSKIRPRVVTGPEGLIEVATHPDSDLVVSAIVGVHGLLPTLEAIESGKTIALANKEIMVIAGDIVCDIARENGVTILPVDSEHNAIHQCLRSGRLSEVHRIILTASGGPFWRFSREMLEDVTPEMALNHPTWSMGNRFTVDSATLMNKGFEVMEAHWLFNFPVDQISVLIHPQSIVHSMVEFLDGSVMAQLGATDMRHPLQYALTYPDRIQSARPRLDFRQVRNLEFIEPELDQFPCLELALEAARRLGIYPCILNAADEVAVEHFLDGKVRFPNIPQIIGKMLDSVGSGSKFSTAQELLQYDGMVRQETRRLIESDYV